MRSERQEYELGSCLDALIDYRGKSPPKSETGVPVISAKVVKGGRIIEPVEQTIELSYYSEWMRRGLPQVGDVVMTTEAPLGEVAQLTAKTAQYALGQRIVTMRGRDGRLNNTYFKYLLLSDELQDRLRRYATGTTVAGISQNALRSVLLPLPEFDEQRSVAKILRDLDDKIELLRETSRTLEDIARAVFRAWFVDFEPVRAKAAGAVGFRGMPQDIFDNLSDEFEDAAAGPMPMGWKVEELGSLVGLRNERVKAGAPTEALPYITIDCIDAKSIWLMQEKPGAEAQSSLIKIYPNDILFGAMRPYFHKVCIVPFEATTRTTVFVLAPKQSSDLLYSLMVLSEDKTVEFATASSVGSTIPYAKWEVMERMEIALPPCDVRKAYGNCLVPIVERGMRIKAEIDTLTQLRDAILPRLISGELEAPSLETLGLRAVGDGG